MLLVNGTALLRSGKHNSALPLLLEAYELLPDDPDAALNLGGAYILAGKFRQAVSVLETLLEVEPDNAMLWLNLGAAYLGNPVLALDRHQRQAIDAFVRALELQPDTPSAAYNIGLIYRDRRDLDNAIYWFQQAVRHDPDDADAHKLLARSAAERAAEEE
jgi:tetratricopeptide (TPR) repeat protein